MYCSFLQDPILTHVLLIREYALACLGSCKDLWIYGLNTQIAKYIINPYPAQGCNKSPPYYVFSKDAIHGSVSSISSEVLALPPPSFPPTGT